MHLGWAFGTTVAAFLLLLSLFRGAAQLRASAHHESVAASLETLQRSALTLGLVQAAAFGLVILFGVRFFGGRDASLRETLAVRPVSARVMLAAFVAGLSLQFPLAELAHLVELVAPIPPEMIQRQYELFAATDARSVLALFFTVVVVAPVTEELFFRGLIMRGVRSKHGAVIAWLSSSVLFGLSHPSAIATIVYSMVAGLILGFVSFRTNSILSSLVMHAGVNFLPIALPERLVPIAGFNMLSESGAHLPWLLVLASSLVAALSLTLLMRFTASKPNDV